MLRSAAGSQALDFKHKKRLALRSPLPTVCSAEAPCVDFAWMSSLSNYVPMRHSVFVQGAIAFVAARITRAAKHSDSSNNLCATPPGMSPLAWLCARPLGDARWSRPAPCASGVCERITHCTTRDQREPNRYDMLSTSCLQAPCDIRAWSSSHCARVEVPQFMEQSPASES